MNTAKILSLIAVVFLATGCYQKYLVFQADAVSMTKSDAGDIKKLKESGQVDEKWCTGDDLAMKGKDNDIGLADQVIYKAQGGGKKADFITDAKIYRDSDGCALLTGKLAKM